MTVTFLPTFTTQPIRGAGSFALGIQPVVTVQQGGRVLTSDSTTAVTLRIQAATGTPGATLTCTNGTTKTVEAGTASYSGCQVDLKGEGYVLEAVAGGTTLGATAPFNVIWAGDANGDCLVDIVDFSVMVYSFGKRLGDAGFDSRADLNGDNVVDIVDFSVLVTLFGTRCPTLGLSPISAPGGTVVTVTGSAYVNNREVSVTLDGVVMTTTPGTVTSTGSGGFTASFTVPANTPSGTHVVKASQRGGRVVSAAVFNVP